MNFLPITEGPGELALKLVADMERLTLDRIGLIGLQNAERNQAVLDRGRSLAALREEKIGEGDSCIVIAAATASSQAVVRRLLETRMKIYWWNPMYDDPDQPDSVTRSLFKQNRMPCLNAGGNVGTACWMTAHAVLAKKHVAVVGMDFSYYDDTPYLSTQYYHDLVALVGEANLDSVFVRIHNPYLQRWFYTDPAYMWYRNVFLDLVQDADCRTHNCTEGGILFGDGIVFEPLNAFLQRFC